MLANFNSTIVRLKVTNVLKLWTIKKFQFYDSTIKSASMEFATEKYKDFNSTIVRLKATRDQLMTSDILFQFYDSTIKRLVVSPQDRR